MFQKKFNCFTKKIQKKKQILIFGASKGGESVYRALRNEYSVIGFVDNNKLIQGGKIFNIKIYSPFNIANIDFDKIVIASDYHVEIREQLIHKLSIDEMCIVTFNLSDIVKPLPLFSFSDFFTYIVCNQPFKKAHRLFSFLSRITHFFNLFTLKEIIWLDELSSHRVKLFCQEEKVLSYAPKTINQKQKSSFVTAPEVSLYQFKKGQIMTAANVVVFGGKVAVGRVPSFPVEFSQYDAAFFSFHGKKNALIKKYQINYLDQGIAIIGSSDTNYYHWVIEVLSKIQFLIDLPEKFKNYPILLSEQSEKIPSIKAYIKLLGINQPIIYLKSGLCYEVEDLLYISPANYLVANLKTSRRYSLQGSFVRFESLTYLRDSLINVLPKETSTSYPEYIFLARKGVIRDYNQGEVFELLEDYGFEPVYLEDFTLIEQVGLMQNAKVIIGPTGAAWTNLIFCNSDVLALCWMADEYGDLSCFSNLAKFAGVKMDYLRFKTGCQSTRDLYYAKYTVDVNKIKLWLESKGINKNQSTDSNQL